MAKPDCVSDEKLDEILEYLDVLRDSGATNMFGAGEFISASFGLSKEDAKSILGYWMRTFSEKKKKQERVDTE